MSFDTTKPEEGKDFTTKEGWHNTDDGAKLYTKTWTPVGDIKARMVFIHGFSDYCNNQGNFLTGLAKRGIEVCSWDQRGAGYSVHKPKDKGNAGQTPRVLADITSFINSLPETPAPLFIAGHSMGGGETLYYIARGDAAVRRRVRGYLALAPLIGLSPKTRPPRLLEAAGRVAVKVVPRFQFKNEIKAELLSRDAAVCDSFRRDELCHCIGTLEQFQGMLDRGAELDEGRVKVAEADTGRAAGETGLLLAHGTKDDVTWCDSSRRFVERVEWKDKQYKQYDGWYHVMQRELGDDAYRFTHDIAEWILARS